MWERLLLSLRRHGKHGRWGEQFSDPLLRQTFAGQYAMRVRPTTSSNIVWHLEMAYVLLELWCRVLLLLRMGRARRWAVGSRC